MPRRSARDKLEFDTQRLVDRLRASVARETQKVLGGGRAGECVVHRASGYSQPREVVGEAAGIGLTQKYRGG
jgi:hypothetical protein